MLKRVAVRAVRVATLQRSVIRPFASGPVDLSNVEDPGMPLNKFERVMEVLFTPLLKISAKKTEKELRALGLVYEDLLHADRDPAVAEALEMIPLEARLAREQRQARALDLSLKHAHMPADLAAAYDPFESYMGKAIRVARARRLEELHNE